MNTKAIILIKKAAAILILLCSVLPLSRCTTKAEVGGQTEVRETDLYAYELAGAAWDGVKANEPGRIYELLAVLNVFLVPVIGLAFKGRLQAAIHFFASFAAAYFLYCWVFVFATRPQIGGIVAIVCWLVLFGLSCATLLVACRGGRFFSRAAGG